MQRWTGQEDDHMRKGKSYEYDGQTHTLPEWAMITGISAKTLRARLYAGWTVEKALTTEIQRKGPVCTAKSLKDCDTCPFDDCIRIVPLPDEKERSI